MKYLGIDYGTKRIGLATSDEGGSVAFPFKTIEAGKGAHEEIATIIKQEKIEKIVLGESKDFKGEANPVMQHVEQFKKDLEETSGVKIEYEPEFFSSSAAARQFTPDGSRKENPSHENLDAAAAALILQGYLDRLKNHARENFNR